MNMFSKSVVLTLVTLLAACSGADGQDGSKGDRGESTLIDTAEEPAGNNCANGGTRLSFGVDANEDGALQADEVSRSTFVCNGADGSGMDGQNGMDGTNGMDGQDGMNGQNGASTLINTSDEQPGANCANGGQKIEAGVDANNDGVLDAAEIGQTSYVCNGQDGTNGMDGQDGTNGTDGTNGMDGQDGNNSLINITDEPNGMNCPIGGKRIDVGVDDDGNNTLDMAEIDQTAYICNPSDAVTLSTIPDPTVVFNNPDACYVFTNNLITSIWDRVSNQIITGYFSRVGYWKFAPGSSNWSANPDQGTNTQWSKILLVPGPRKIIGARNGYRRETIASHYMADIDDNGNLSNQQSITLSDGYTGFCDMISNSHDEFLCYDGTSIRHYRVGNSTTLQFVKSVTLAQQPVRSDAYGGTFAWDGEFYHLPESGYSSNSRAYRTYNADGSVQGLHNVTGGNNINATYFNWSVGRYSTHDGFGNRREGTVYIGVNANSDSHCFGPPSPYHNNTL